MSSKETYESDFLELKKSITNQIAALKIADKNFPLAEDMPFTKLPSYMNFGHHCCFDYKAYSEIILGTMTQIQGLASSWEVANNKKALRTASLVGVLSTVLFFLAGLQMNIQFILGPSAGLIIAGIGYFVMKGSGKERLIKEIADYRATVVESLLDGRYNSQNSEEIKNELKDLEKKSSDGFLRYSSVNVVVVKEDTHPFPGYGYLQLDELFLCPPKDFSSLNTISTNDLKNAIQGAIIKNLKNINSPSIGFGNIASVYGESIKTKSKWLKDGAPKLNITLEEYNELTLTERLSSFRMFIAVQMVFKEHGTIATFLIRPFIASESAACQIAVTTIGPPKLGRDYLREELLQYYEEVKESSERRSWKFQSDVNVDMLKNIKISRKTKWSDQDKEKSIKWHGAGHIYHGTREKNSTTFKSDFFGVQEVKASISMAYELISKSVLTELEKMNYDVSRYRNSQGEFNISTKEVGKMIVAENVYYTGKNSDKDSLNKGKGDSNN